MINKFFFIVLGLSLAQSSWAYEDVNELLVDVETAAEEATRDAELAEREEKAYTLEAVKKKGWLDSAGSSTEVYQLNLNYFTDTSSSYASRMQVWVKNIILKDTVKDGLSVGDYTMSLQEYDCTNNTSKVLESVSYNVKTGSTIDSYKPPYPKEHKIVPGSVGEQLLRDICMVKNELF